MKTTTPPLTRLALVPIVALLMILAGCGSSTDVDQDAAPVETDSETGQADGESGEADGESGEADSEAGEADAGDSEAEPDTDDAMIEGEHPQRIVSLSPTATEMLYAIGAGDQVAAVDLYSNYPTDAPAGTLDGFVPDLEAIVAVEPDLVVSMGLPDEIVSGLDELGIAHMTQPAAGGLDDMYAQIADLGLATGQIDGAAKANADVRAGVDEVLASLPDQAEPLTVFHEIDDSFYTATSNTFIGQVYTAMGMDNIADVHDDGTGYPLIDGEAIIAADPDVIVYTSQAPYDRSDITARPGWDGVSAVANDRVIEVDADVASRWGPRIVQFMEAIAAALA